MKKQYLPAYISNYLFYPINRHFSSTFEIFSPFGKNFISVAVNARIRSKAARYIITAQKTAIIVDTLCGKNGEKSIFAKKAAAELNIAPISGFIVVVKKFGETFECLTRRYIPIIRITAYAISEPAVAP